MEDLRPFVILGSNDHQGRHLLAYGADDYLLIEKADAQVFDQLKEYLDSKPKTWVFGSFSYDLKNAVEDLSSNNIDEVEYPDLFFFRPKNMHEFKSREDLEDFVLEHFVRKEDLRNIELECRTSKEEYLKHIESILHHIHRGDIYEVNYCMEFFKKDWSIDPLTRFFRLNEMSSAPFSAYLSFDQKHVLCGSPERFIKKEGDTIISQPIKGTIKRGKNQEEDDKLVQQLKMDPKERSENIMITDLVRNDLSKTAAPGSVQVEELCEVYTFKTVHQLISTVTSKIKTGVHPVDVIKNAFPMGSMTGAPKVRAMEIIEEEEDFKRGIYSGSIGYFDPQGDFDFNVVIRSLIYNEKNHYLSARVGGAITALSDPEREYDECLLKMESMKRTLL